MATAKEGGPREGGGGGEEGIECSLVRPRVDIWLLPFWQRWQRVKRQVEQ